jgi:FkbM family methyltransferase
MVEANPSCEPHLRLLNQPYEIVALSDKEGYADLYVETINPVATGASLYKENTEWYGEGKYKTIKVPTKTLDSCNYFNNESIDLIKIDVQGAELDILSGGRSTIMRSNYVLIEVSTIEYNVKAPLMDEIVPVMKSYGFYIEDILDYLKPSKKQITQMDLLFKNSYIF